MYTNKINNIRYACNFIKILISKTIKYSLKCMVVEKKKYINKIMTS